jgi:putative FmdB family regulatory protein
MPIFEFRCQACGNEFEKLVFGSDAVECPSCHQADVEKLMSACSAKVGYKFTAASNPKGASCGGCSATSCSICH